MTCRGRSRGYRRATARARARHVPRRRRRALPAPARAPPRASDRSRRWRSPRAIAARPRRRGLRRRSHRAIVASAAALPGSSTRTRSAIARASSMREEDTSMRASARARSGDAGWTAQASLNTRSASSRCPSSHAATPRPRAACRGPAIALPGVPERAQRFAATPQRINVDASASHAPGVGRVGVDARARLGERCPGGVPPYRSLLRSSAFVPLAVAGGAGASFCAGLGRGASRERLHEAGQEAQRSAPREGTHAPASTSRHRTSRTP